MQTDVALTRVAQDNDAMESSGSFKIRSSASILEDDDIAGPAAVVDDDDDFWNMKKKKLSSYETCILNQKDIFFNLEALLGTFGRWTLKCHPWDCVQNVYNKSL